MSGRPAVETLKSVQPKETKGITTSERKSEHMFMCVFLRVNLSLGFIAKESRGEVFRTPSLSTQCSICRPFLLIVQQQRRSTRLLVVRR